MVRCIEKNLLLKSAQKGRQLIQDKKPSLSALIFHLFHTTGRNCKSRLHILDNRFSYLSH